MLGKLVGFLRTRGFQRGVLGSSSKWLGVWAGLTVARELHKRIGKEPELVERVVLKPGQTVEISDTGVTWKDAGA
jgi:hypothetical protein